MSMRSVYKRILIKISGEILCGDKGFGIHPPTVSCIAEELATAHSLQTQIALVIGGGQYFSRSI